MSLKRRFRSQKYKVVTRDEFDTSVRLFTIRLPMFDGKYENWLEFRDTFGAFMHNNEKLSNIHKFLYLRSSLEKNVFQIIKSIEVTEVNYETAWQFLVDRFENKRLIIHNHIRAIFEYPSIVKESFVKLRNLYDNKLKNLRSLKALGEETEAGDRLIKYLYNW